MVARVGAGGNDASACNVVTVPAQVWNTVQWELEECDLDLGCQFPCASSEM